MSINEKANFALKKSQNTIFPQKRGIQYMPIQYVYVMDMATYSTCTLKIFY